MESKFVELIKMLSEVYDDEGVAIWLWSRQKRWGERYHGWKKYLKLFSDGGFPSGDYYCSPLDLIKDGRIDEVLAAAEQLVTGAMD